MVGALGPSVSKVEKQDSGGKVRKDLLKSKKDAKWDPSVYTTVVPAQFWPSLRGVWLMEIIGHAV